MSNAKAIIKDKKLQKSFLNLQYLAYIFIVIVLILGVGFTTYAGVKGYMSDKSLGKYFTWLPVFYIVTFMIVWGILDVLKMLENLKNGNIFTIENATLLKTIDKKLIFTLLFSIISNVVMTLLGVNEVMILLLWIVFCGFILAGHILVHPLAILVEKSAEMRLEMELTI